MDLEFSFDRL